jgi:hypothetical protein
LCIITGVVLCNPRAVQLVEGVELVVGVHRAEVVAKGEAAEGVMLEQAMGKNWTLRRRRLRWVQCCCPQQYILGLLPMPEPLPRMNSYQCIRRVYLASFLKAGS